MQPISEHSKFKIIFQRFKATFGSTKKMRKIAKNELVVVFNGNNYPM